MSDFPDKTVIESWMAASAAIHAKDMSVSELTTHFLTQIEEKNPVINAFRQSDAARAIQKAVEIDARIAAGETIGRLAGLPIAVKENCDTLGYSCSAGLSFRSDHTPSIDSGIIKRLKDEDAIILGITICDPGAFSVRTAQVIHPNNPNLTVGGSSGGSGAAVNAGLCLGAIGTDTGGSIRIPAACCGVYGLKPTYGSLPMEGIFPLVQSLDHVGPMARSIEDVKSIWSGLAKRHNEDLTPIKSIGFDPNYLTEADDRFNAEFDIVLKACSNLGIALVEIEQPALASVIEMHGTIFLVEAAGYHHAHHAEHISQYPEISREWFEIARSIPMEDYLSACELRRKFTRIVNSNLHKVDLILTPTMIVREPSKFAEEFDIKGETTEFTMALVRHTALYDHTGHPVLAMPIPTTEQISSSLQIIGAHNRENGILNFATNLIRQIHS